MPFWVKQFLKDKILWPDSNFALRLGAKVLHDVLVYTGLFIVLLVKSRERHPRLKV